MDIFKIIDEKFCTTSLQSKTKDECLEKIAELISSSCPDFTKDELFAALKEREDQGSTGFEDGIAMPHARLKKAKQFMLGIAISSKGIDFKSLDGKKSHVFFILVGPVRETSVHLKLLAQISRVAKDKRAIKEIRSAVTKLSLKEAFLRNVRGFAMEKRYEAVKDKLLIFVLYETKFLNDILELFLERGIRGATVLESRGMRNVLSNVPLFGDFLNFLGEQSDESSTIMTKLAEEEISPLIYAIEEIMGDLDTHSGALVLAVDVFFSKGSLEVY